MAKFTIQKTVQDGKTSIEILTPTVEPLVMHYNSDAGEFGPYMLSDYTEELASQNGVQSYIGSGVFTLDNLKKVQRDHVHECHSIHRDQPPGCDY